MANCISIQDLDMPGLAPYAHLNEPQLRHFFEPNGGIFIGESPEVILRAIRAGYEPLSLLIESRYLETEAKPILELVGDMDVPVYTAELSVLCAITGYHLTRGILCAFHRKPLLSPQELLEGARRVAVLEDVENPTNVGAIFRSAAALNMDAVLLTPRCSDPLYRRAIRVSVGTVFQIPWTYLVEEPAKWPEGGVQILRGQGFRTAAMALRDDAVSIEDPEIHACRRLAIMVGNEFFGIRPETIAMCDYAVRIPMAHGVDSLNVAAASAVAFWELGRRSGE